MITRIKAAMQALDISQAELARQTGLSCSGISQYLSGTAQPSERALDKICKALEIMPETGTTRISVKHAAELIGVDPQTLRVALQKKVVPFGAAWKVGKRYKYIIYPQKFEEYTGIKVGENLT